MRKITLKPTLPARLERHLAEDLNDAQRAAATAPDGWNLILAGPGSGKTRVITYRVAYFIGRGIPANSILLVTFTRRAAREMVHRLRGLIGPEADRVWAGTFHHIGNRLLRRAAELLGFQPNFTILDGEDQIDLMRLAMADSFGSVSTRPIPRPAEVLQLLSLAINTRQPLAQAVLRQAPAWLDWLPQIEAVAEAYAARKRRANALDYDDLLWQWLRLVREFPQERQRQGAMFRQILIDEMQDTNALQVEIVETIAEAGAGNLTAVGDDAQSIYRFRGANYDNILKFSERHPSARTFQLDRNYRSTPQIVALIADSIRHNRTGFPKQLVSVRADGLVPAVAAAADVHEEASLVCQWVLETREGGVPLRQMAVLYRNHYDSVVLQGELISRGIPYSVRSGVRFFEQAHVKDVLAYLRVVVNPLEEASWRRLLLLLPGIGPAKAAAVYERLVHSPAPLQAIESAEVMAVIPPRSRGVFAAFVGDLRRIIATNPEHSPAVAIEAVLAGGYPAILQQKYDRPENRLADLEQFAVLAAKYESLERMLAELLLAGDVYGMDTLAAGDPIDHLVLSTVHQAKGLEWSRVFLIRLVEDSFPHRRALDEEDGEEEERRIFYVAISRAMDELVLTYPSALSRGPGGPIVLGRPSRFLTELDERLLERVQIDHEHWPDEPDELPAPASRGGRRPR
jgi:DNA helicase-2/ATP-dependent DNA helicase PcrA